MIGAEHFKTNTHLKTIKQRKNSENEVQVRKYQEFIYRDKVEIISIILCAFRHRFFKKAIQKSNTIISCHEILFSITNKICHQKS